MSMFDSNSIHYWLEYIQGIHFRSIDLTLDRVKAVAGNLNFSDSFITIAVAGTNGKGSSVAYLESIYRYAGYKTAVYTSPHLVEYNERIRINNVPVEDQALIDAFRNVESARQTTPLTYFEFGTLAAMCVFEQSKPDVCILEVGMGGRLDAVNIFKHDISLITEISLDHQAWLGSTVAEIAIEKAGIMHAGWPTVGSGLRPPAYLESHAKEIGCNRYQLGEHYGYEIINGRWNWIPLCDWKTPVFRLDGLRIPDGGVHQLQNAAGAIAVAQKLQPELPVRAKEIETGLRKRTLPARCQVIDHVPTIILDVSHNIDGLRALNSFLQQFSSEKRLIAVFSMLADKDCADAIREVYSSIKHWVVTSVDSERSQTTDSLCSVLESIGTAPIIKSENPESAVSTAIEMANADDCVVVFGSFYLVGDIMKFLNLHPYPSN